MIRFSAILSVVVVAVGLLVAGAVSGSLPLVYLAIGVAALALLMLAIGAIVWRDEIFGEAAVGRRPEYAAEAVTEHRVSSPERKLPVGLAADGQLASPSAGSSPADPSPAKASVGARTANGGPVNGRTAAPASAGQSALRDQPEFPEVPAFSDEPPFTAEPPPARPATTPGPDAPEAGKRASERESPQPPAVTSPATPTAASATAKSAAAETEPAAEPESAGGSARGSQNGAPAAKTAPPPQPPDTTADAAAAADNDTADNDTADNDTADDDTADNDAEVTVVPGIGRYHLAGCILIRFLGAEDLQVMTRQAAETSGCVPCKACRPEK